MRRDDYEREIIDNIRKYRQARGLTQEELARRCDMQTGYIGGIPNRTERSSGATKPTAAPYCQPQTRPHKSTGICIGSSMLPICGIWPVSMGSTRHSAKNSAA